MARTYASITLLAALLAGGCFTPDDTVLDTDSDADEDETAGDDDDDDDDDDDTTTGDDDDDDTTTGDDDDDDDTTGGDDDDDDDDDDTTTTGDDDDDSTSESTGDAPPQVVDIEPAEAATGVLSDANIIVTFSEPMDTTATEAAFGTANLGPVAFSWSDGDTVLTINPNSNLAYAAGTNPDIVEANEYTFSIAQTATDIAGNALEEQVLSNFFTARAITETLTHDAAYSGAVASNGVEQTGSGGDPVVGDLSDNLQRKGFMGFALTALPGDVLDVLDAQLAADQYLTLGAPFSFGSIGLSHVAAEDLPGGLFNAPAQFDLGIFSNSATDGPRTANVTSTVLADVMAGESYTQYRLEFAIATDNDGANDRTRFHNEALTVTYLIP